jgi:hypothetical protein
MFENQPTFNPMKKFFKWTEFIIVFFILGIFSFVSFSWDKKFDIALPEIKASTDRAVIARGKYVAYGPLDIVPLAICLWPNIRKLKMD